MTFNEKLNEHLAALRCSAKALSASSGLSQTVISRYRSGERLPNLKGNQLDLLCEGLSALYRGKGITEKTASSLKTEFTEIITGGKISPRTLSSNLNQLITTLDINKAQLSRFLNYDPSYLSRICSGQRTPANPEKFITEVCRFIVKKYNLEIHRRSIADLLDCSINQLEKDYDYQGRLMEWFGKQNSPSEDTDSILALLQDLNDYDPAQLPSDDACRQLSVIPEEQTCPVPNVLYDADGMIRAEKTFYHFSGKPDSDIIFNLCFGASGEYQSSLFRHFNRWICIICGITGEGHRVILTHNLKTSFPESLRILRAFVPVMMKVSVKDYNMRESWDSSSHHLEFISDHAVLCGECLYLQDPGKGRFYITDDAQEINYYKSKSAFSLQNAVPMIDVFHKERESEFRSLLMHCLNKTGERKMILQAPPLFTMTDDFLDEVLTTASVSDEIRKKIKDFKEFHRGYAERLLAKTHFHLQAPVFTEQEFRFYRPSLTLTGLYLEKEIHYTMEQYQRHLKMTREYEELHHTFHFEEGPAHPFQMIQLYIHEGNMAVITRKANPSVHIVIRHPKLRSALENMVMPPR